ncbi:hypothetical protein, partial [Streptomyces huasconensis]|uniref:hypothetical protein n=1 Tax=Streptomyces huasconensis TaxID=1854574 RepID=UPI0033E28CE8
AGDYTGSLFSLAVVYLVPVIVASQVSSVDNARTAPPSPRRNSSPPGTPTRPPGPGSRSS